jgi:hypothetical protein
MRGRWHVVTDVESGVRFHFAFDATEPNRLHIDVRHGATPGDAVRTFFDPLASTAYDERHKRWERWAGEWLIAWLWLDEPERRNVLVITCLNRKGGLP